MMTIGEEYNIVGIDTGAVKVSVPQPATPEKMVGFELSAEGAITLGESLIKMGTRLKEKLAGEK